MLIIINHFSSKKSLFTANRYCHRKLQLNTIDKSWADYLRQIHIYHTYYIYDSGNILRLGKIEVCRIAKCLLLNLKYSLVLLRNVCINKTKVMVILMDIIICKHEIL